MSGDYNRSHYMNDTQQQHQIEPELMNTANYHEQSLTGIDQGTHPAIPMIHQRPSQQQQHQHQQQGDLEVSAGFDFSNTPPELQPETTATPTLPSQTAGIAMMHESSQVLGPEGSAEDALSTASEASLTAPALKLTLLCVTGARVVMCIDKQFIDLHSLPVKDPESINVGQLKKVIYDEWMNAQKEAETGGVVVPETAELTDSEEVKKTVSAPKSLSNNSLDKTYTRNWGAVLAAAVSPGPTSPSHIRLIHLGKVLVDEYTLEEYKINTSNAFHVVHLSVKPDAVNGGKQDKPTSKSKSKLPGLRHARSALSASSSRPNHNHNHGAADGADGAAAAANGGSDGIRSSSARSGCCIIS